MADPQMPGEAVSVVKRQVAALLAAGSALVVALFTTSLVLAVRTLIITMPEGGQAPPWIWIVPVSIVLAMIMVFANLAAARVAEGFGVVLLFWLGVFGGLGGVMLEAALRHPGENALVFWIDGPIFLVMGLAVVPAIIGGARGAWARIGTLAGGPGLHGADAFYVPLNVAAILAGIGAGVITFLNVSR
ncbi:MAG: hypothetical protein FDZ70_02550 [Actinobacteria bacterium]|nr:MAG: hypothetical protein FDZ70_02550 [Actinomycetota bacterium]